MKMRWRVVCWCVAVAGCSDADGNGNGESMLADAAVGRSDDADGVTDAPDERRPDPDPDRHYGSSLGAGTPVGTGPHVTVDAAMGVTPMDATPMDATPMDVTPMDVAPTDAGVDGSTQVMRDAATVPSSAQDASSDDDDGGSDNPGACQPDRHMASTAGPLDIYMMVDDSGSMVPWWPGTLDALNMFLEDPNSAGMGVGMQFFGSNCDPGFYQSPRVPIAPLPANTPALQAAFPVIPVAGTATLPAVQGAIAHARQRVTQFPNSTVVVLLVTDGLPVECGSTVDNVTAAIEAGYSGSPSIKTFVVGLGADLMALDGFAAAGGTGQAQLVQPGAAAELLRAVNSVRSDAGHTCEYAVPSVGSDGPDPALINLSYTDGSGTEAIVGNVPDAASCDDIRGGWYLAPGDERLHVCPASCAAMRGGTVSIDVGCPTVTLSD